MPTWVFPVLAAIVVVVGGVIVLAVARPGGGPGGAPPPGDDRSEPDAQTGTGEPQGDRPRPPSLHECGRSETLTIPYTDIAVDPLSRAQEIEIGREVIAEVLATSAVADDAAQQDRLARLLDRIVPADTDAEYSVRLIDTDEVNAFALPGGALVFTSAIVEQLDDGELGFVMSHEVAHVECRHIAQQLEREALAVAGIDAVLGDLVDGEELYRSEAGQTLAFLASLSFSREDEAESDLVALDLMDAAKIPLAEAVNALEHLRSIEGDVPSGDHLDLFLTHPPTADRIEDVRQAIASR